MRIPVFILFSFIFFITHSQTADSSGTKLKAGATVSLNSNGIASIPAFSLDKPAIIAAISLAKGRFSYEPTLAYGFDLRPWVIDNFLQYKLINRTSFEFRVGMIISTFFCKYKLPEQELLQGQRYFTYIFTGIYKFSPHSTMTLAYWNDRGQDYGTIKGHYFNLVGERSEINIGKYALMSVALQLFYINYDGNNDGLFVSPKISFKVRNIPFSIFLMAIQAIESNISPYPQFRWNAGLAYRL